MKPMIGPLAKIDGGSFVTADPRRPCSSDLLGQDIAYLWHVGSFAASPKYLPVSGSSWGNRGALVRIPKALVLVAHDSVFTEADASPLFNAMIDMDVSVARGRGDIFHPLAFGGPLGEDVLGGDPARGGLLPSMLANNLFRGGKVLVATITAYRVAFVPTATNDSPRSDDYFRINGASDYTIYTSDAADHLSKIRTALQKYDKFRSIFYQASQEYTFSPGVTSSMIPDSSLNALLGGDPRFQRTSYSPGGYASVFSSIISVAANFFSE